MNTESATIFTELDKLTENNSNTDFTLPDVGTEQFNSTSNSEAER